MREETESTKLYLHLGLAGVLVSLLAGSGCAGRQAVYACTGTSIGVEISQNPATQLYQAKLGYNRAELAIVPSNRSADKESGIIGNGAKDCPDVMMELHYSGIFSTSAGGGIYQRLAVGSKAVEQPGAAFLMAKAADGSVSTNTAEAISRSLQTIKQVTIAAESNKVAISQAYAAATADTKKAFDAVVSPQYKSFSDFLADPTTSLAQVQAIAQALRAKGLIQ